MAKICIIAVIAIISIQYADVVKAELNTWEEPDTLFLLTFQTPVGSYSDGDSVDALGTNAVPGTFVNVDGTPQNITYDDISVNPFCFVGLHFQDGNAITFYPSAHEWGMAGNFTLEIWSTAKTGTGYTYYEDQVFGFPKHAQSRTSVSILSNYAASTTFTANFTVTDAETLDYAAISYNGTHFSAYQNGINKLTTPMQRTLVTDPTTPLVTIGGFTKAGFAPMNYEGYLYMVKYSSTAKSQDYFTANWNAYLQEIPNEFVFTGVTSLDRCSQLCMNGQYGFGGRKKCRSYNYLSDTQTCTLRSFVCDWTGVQSSLTV